MRDLTIAEAGRARPDRYPGKGGELDPLLTKLEPARLDQAGCPERQRIWIQPREGRNAVDFTFRPVGQIAMIDPEV